MQIRREILIGVGTALAMVVIVAFGSIGLLVRMGPAIQNILENNVSSLVAVETMLTVLAETPPGTEDARRRFQRGLDDARATVTEAGEPEAIEVIDASWRDAIAGDAPTRLRALRALNELTEVNRNAMLRADRDARLLGSAGAWTAAFLGAMTFSLGLLGLGRLRRRLLEPLTEIYDVVTAPASLNIGRRCTATEGFTELREIQTAVNDLLDARLRGRQNDEDHVARVLLLQLLDEDPLPAFAFDARGKLVAANVGALELLETASVGEIRERIDKGSSDDEGLEITAIGETGGTLVRFRDRDRAAE